ncbi:MAG: DoxX family membrane protein [Patescibacteria group bacterium]|nr:DoxX family membrane protein [Patescibacteria group bacterium]
MLNPFPQLFVYGFFAPTLLRIAAAGVFFYLAYWHFKTKKEVAHELTVLSHEMAVWIIGLYMLIELAVGAGLFLGFWTQVDALLGFIISIKVLLLKRSMHAMAPLSRTAYVLLAVICLSLLASGAGAFAIDLPL